MLLPLSPFRRVLTQFCGLPVAIPILLELSLALLQLARQCEDVNRDRSGEWP
jgi:hypothetical protein